MPPVSSDPIVRRLLNAEGFLELGMPSHALEILQSRSDWATVQFEASYLTGEALRELGKHREALSALETAANIRPNNVHVAIAQGWCYKRTHRLAQAIDALERARCFHPDQPLIRYNLACYWSLAGDMEHCLEELSEALRLEPSLRSQVETEEDFNPVRNDPEFRRLLAGRSQPG